MNRLLLSALLMLLSITVQAQTQNRNTSSRRTGSVSGQIIDSSTSEPLFEALIEFRSVSDTTFVHRAKSLQDGKFTASNLPYGAYTVEVSYLGYETYYTKMTVNARNMTVAAFYMVQGTLVAEGVEVVGQMIRVSMHGDTIVYNPNAFKYAEDADAEAVIKQLPGVEVTDEGVTVQGKNVAKILVDNKETYGTDVKETMRTIPAEMLKSIQTYEKLSDFAETTGVSDGDKYTVMNFVTDIKFAYFGDLSAMYGWDDMYAAGARWNIVTGDHRFGINGGANNTGALAAFDDMVAPGMFGGGGYGGAMARGSEASANSKTRNMSSGMTYHFEPSEDFRLNAHYRYGGSDNESRSSSETFYFNDRIYDYDRQTSTSRSRSDNDDHNMEAMSRWKIDAHNTINVRIGGSFSDGSSSSFGRQEYFEDGVLDLIQLLATDGDSNNSSYNLSGQINYGVKLGDSGRSFRIGLNGGMSKNDGNSYIDGHTIRRISKYPFIDSLGRSRSLSDRRNHTVQWQAEYFEPLSEYLHVLLSVDGRYSYSNRDSRAEKWDYLPDHFDDGEWVAWGQGSGVMTQRDSRHRIAPGLSYSKNNDEFQLRAGYSRFDLDGESVLPIAWKDSRSFDGLYFNIYYKKQITPQKSAYIQLGSESETPDLDDLQAIDHISPNSLLVSGGNPDLKRYTSYWTMISYNSFELSNSSSFSAWVHGDVSLNSIGMDRYSINDMLEGWDPATETWTSPNGTKLIAGQEYTRSINIDRSIWSVNVGTTYGRPLPFLKSNFNARLSWSLSESPGSANGEDNIARSNYFVLSTDLNSNFSEDLIIGLNYRIMPQFTTNTNKGFRDNQRLAQSAEMSFYWLTWKNFVFRAEAKYDFMHSKQDGVDKPIRYESVMANIAIGKKLFKNRRGEITFAINDLFDQTDFNSSSSGLDRMTYSVNRGLGRYYSLSFSYRLRDFSRDDRGGRRNGSGYGRGQFRRLMI